MNIYVSYLIANFLHALKGQKLIAQGIALGCFGR